MVDKFVFDGVVYLMYLFVFVVVKGGIKVVFGIVGYDQSD